MLITTIENILLLIFSFPSKLDKQLNIFCNIILSQMKTISNKKQNEINLKINNAKINENSEVNNKTIDIDNNNRMRINTTSKNENTNTSDN